MLLGGCVTPSGNFCDIAKPAVFATPTVAGYLVKHDPDHARQDIAANEYGIAHCKMWRTALPSEGN